ncbi:MAG: radical SAM protein [Myxococcaceae bacterium]|jgi:radical SAM protein with 4Fe4S-binding SPASM domain|nr:radical SAM protein [Myxococcaceae bacterium]MCA3011452.1 radical SAM protein [Myxococcaceae bacterium]
MTKVEKPRTPRRRAAAGAKSGPSTPEKPAFAYAERLKDYRRTAYAVWEITLKCNLGCTHCGSRAGDKREDELSTAEALDLVQQLADAGITEVSLIGGEAFLRPDWLEITRAIADAGMIPTMVTGGYGISLATAQKMRDAGMAQVSISLDGLEKTHDTLRGKPGSFFQALQTARNFRTAGLEFGCNSQINRRSAPELPRLYEVIRDAGANGWQFSLTVPMGNAADRPELLIQPVELLELFPVLARVTWRANREGVRVIPGNDIGFFGPYEEILREEQFRLGAFWQGCQAGLGSLGIEADGKIKGCPSLPSDSYVGGNVRDLPLQEILKAKELTFNLEVGGTTEGTRPLWGFCKTCDYADLCRGGCTWTAHVFFDKPGNNPHCHHRALTMQSRGLRERVELREKASGLPFDNGVYELKVEPLDAPWPQNDPLRFTADKVVWPDSWSAWPTF